MTPHAYAIFLRELVPPELLTLLGDYLHTTHGLSYVACNKIEHLGAFVLAAFVKNKSDTNPWAVQFPTGCVLAIADVSKEVGLGFLAHIQ